MAEYSGAVETARKQVAAAHAVLAGHRPSSYGCCSCGRHLPCSVALACARSSAHHAGILALLRPAV
ncbi:hypothetical protein [Catellatospora methionotrophica]|uniref:hypothetical protein n=1 Tax=Catellatospora methionotrophica TaxID=121620 RepID=UPI0033E1CCB1